jgi:hypothetical protein
MKIALTIPSGRPRVKDVVMAFIHNAALWGYDPAMFSVYLAIDTKMQEKRIEEAESAGNNGKNEFTCVEDFKLPFKDGFRPSRIVYISDEDREYIAEEIVESTGADSKIIKCLFAGRGYSKQRNSALWHALRDGNDFAVCIDDDEAPFIPIKGNNGKLTWENLDFFGPHIKELDSGADITRGPYMGYESPIPADFEDNVPDEILTKLGYALEWGSDIITRRSFFGHMNKVKYLNEGELVVPRKPFLVEYGKYGKHVYTGNIGINLHSAREGKIPIFYSPSNARGEDTIFGMQLRDAVVKEVGAFVFHDPFGAYPKLLEGEFPERLIDIPSTPESTRRFASALMGWLKYAPILIILTSKSENERSARISKMINNIEEPANRMAELFGCPELRECKTILNEYHARVDEHYHELLNVQKEWRNICMMKMASLSSKY